MRRRIAAVALLIAAALAAVAAKPAYDWWHAHRTQQFRSACKAATEAESWDRLDAIATRWVEWDPRSDDGWIYVAEASTQLDKLARAVDALGRVRDSYHGALEALAIRADMQFSDLNRPYDAVATWERMLEIDPLADLARQRLIYFYAMTLQREKMLEQIRKAMTLFCEPPESYTYYMLAYEINFSDGLTLIRKWRDACPDDEALEVAHAIYLAKYSLDRPPETVVQPMIAPGDLSMINACLEKYPANLEVLAFHIDYAIYEGNERRVLELLKQCPESAEKDARFWRYRGWYLSVQEQHEQAEEALRKALELHSADWRIHWTLAGVLRRLERSSEASQATAIATHGKKLHKVLFELPNASSLNRRIVLDLYEYFRQTGPEYVVSALRHRL